MYLVPHSALLDDRRAVADVICTIGEHDAAIVLGQSFLTGRLARRLIAKQRTGVVKDDGGIAVG